ncbi:ribonuclease domain-containing protein [Acidovorax sp. MR-S7]|uniref:ribonuclease domain-containing protein n=1 Tax=Acidovorax sp. MR-S7 TaxID=1268622 RepID=UPI0003D3BE96|nr:ribonuclease [Acidovorax sp. MR-S7]GAD21177.1 guanyl-specific ribonuclease Sa [Acidovorax sp. MR-S7]
MLKAVAIRAYKTVLACALGAAFMLAPAAASARQSSDLPGAAPVALADLPFQGRKTYALILQGGPFPYDKDGTVFGNRERLLPLHKRGYYREYTVKTPGARGRGARRIVCGGAPRTPDACYYTGDHYASFREIRE